jgi:hypothetical protein
MATITAVKSFEVQAPGKKFFPFQLIKRDNIEVNFKLAHACGALSKPLTILPKKMPMP